MKEMIARFRVKPKAGRVFSLTDKGRTQWFRILTVDEDPYEPTEWMSRITHANKPVKGRKR